MSLSRDSFEKLGRSYPGIALHLLSRVSRLISRRLRSTSGWLVEYMHG